jgi:dTDP-4-dehydrorhamnose reductase
MPPDWDIHAALLEDQALPVQGKKLDTVVVDLRERSRVFEMMERVQPDVVVHTASLGNLDYCERKQEEAWRTNVEATRGLLEACRPHDALFVFLSSIYVFDGKSPPYDEEATPNPLSYYARTKLEAEDLVRSLSRRSIILRPTTLYGWHLPSQRTNCVTWLLEKLRQGSSLSIVDDVVNNHLWVEDASKALLSAVEKQALGLFHIGGPTVLNRYELSLKVAEVFGFDPDVMSPVSSDHFPSLAPRPLDSTCRIDKMMTVLEVEPLDPDQGLRRMQADTPLWAGHPVTENDPEPLRAAGSKGS